MPNCVAIPRNVAVSPYHRLTVSPSHRLTVSPFHRFPSHRRHECQIELRKIIIYMLTISYSVHISYASTPRSITPRENWASVSSWNRAVQNLPKPRNHKSLAQILPWAERKYHNIVRRRCSCTTTRNICAVYWTWHMPSHDSVSTNGKKTPMSCSL